MNIDFIFITKTKKETSTFTARCKRIVAAKIRFNPNKYAMQDIHANEPSPNQIIFARESWTIH